MSDGMQHRATNGHDSLPGDIAGLIVDCFRSYNDEFGRITRQAPKRFAEREWKLGQRDAVERIELYDRRIERCVAGLVGRMGPRVADRSTWQIIKHDYADRVAACADSECFKTFFNSITRKVFNTVGVNPDVEFAACDVRPELDLSEAPVFRQQGREPGELANGLLSRFRSTLSIADHPSGIDAIERCIDDFGSQGVEDNPNGKNPIQLEFLDRVFFRSTRAFLVGRLNSDHGELPLVVALRNKSGDTIVDAVISDPNVISSLFGFSRSYLHADLPNVGAAVAFLSELMPQKPIDEIYTVLGRARQGKTERFRRLYQHLEQSDDEFVHADGEKGMVMIVFALPSHDIVFKVIRDRFPHPKDTSHEKVKANYRFVFRNDRVGRLVDAQEFRRLRLPRKRFSDSLLVELLDDAAETCRSDGDDLIIDHCYIERRLRPLNLYIREAGEQSAQRAVIDYGQAIKDLAMSNVFPGDLLLKNFGVSRSGRVIFYDYDELCLITDCSFRDLPTTTHDEDEYRSEPWYYVGPNDVFPEEITNFLGLSKALRDVFLMHHRELLSSQYWRDLKRSHKAEEYLDIIPYPAPQNGEASILKAVVV